MISRKIFMRCLNCALLLHAGIITGLLVLSGCRTAVSPASRSSAAGGELITPIAVFAEPEPQPIPGAGLSVVEPLSDPHAVALEQATDKSAIKVEQRRSRTVKPQSGPVQRRGTVAGKGSKPPATRAAKVEPAVVPPGKEEIAQMLGEGGPLVRGGGQSFDDSACFDLIKVAFVKAWAQPSYADAGDSVARIEIRFNADGSIAGIAQGRSSGNTVLDESVLRAASALRRVDGLPPEFLRKYNDRPITLAFKVTPEG